MCDPGLLHFRFGEPAGASHWPIRCSQRSLGRKTRKTIGNADIRIPPRVFRRALAEPHADHAVERRGRGGHGLASGGAGRAWGADGRDGGAAVGGTV